MNITISTQILSGNLGEGWADLNKTARDLAEYTERIWTADLAAIVAEGHVVDFDIEVSPNTGSSRGVSVNVDPIDEDSIEMEARIDGTLTGEDHIWEVFCNAQANA